MAEISEKQHFADRLNRLCDQMGIPPKGAGRQGELARIFGYSQAGARKWLEGESLPEMELSIRIAMWAGVAVEWLLSGRGPMKAPGNINETSSIYVSERERALLDNIRHCAEEDLRAIERIALLSATETQRKENNLKTPLKNSA